MSMEPKSKSELHHLLAQLARFFNENESKISKEKALKCLQHLSVTEKFALNRLFCLLYQTKYKRPASSRPNASGTSKLPSTASLTNITASTTSNTLHLSKPTSTRLQDPPLATQAVIHHDTCARLTSSTNCSRSVRQSHQRQLSPGSPGLGHRAATPHQAETRAADISIDADASMRTDLDACNEMQFAPKTKKLLEDCKTDRGKFLRAIEDAKATLPTGHGWEAAIATKKVNADIRDIIRIYHRFECYNIYSHVVEAGFHTGTHWIREMRPMLVNKLCQDFPERFQTQKIADKCLNWIDQGCKFHEWAEMLSETADLGYLIALPTDIPHSAYTSRCTKEEMSTAVLKFQTLGISKVVADLELSSLGYYIATKLREMTRQKRNIAFEEPNRSSHKSRRLLTSSGMGQSTMPLASMTVDINDFFDHPIRSFMPAMVHELHGAQERHLDYQNTINTLEARFATSYGALNDSDIGLNVCLEDIMNQSPGTTSPTDQWQRGSEFDDVFMEGQGVFFQHCASPLLGASQLAI